MSRPPCLPKTDLSQPTATPRSTEPAAATVVLEQGAPHEAPEGERRHLTVLFCDLVGSTEIASHLDPEQWREIVGEYHRAAAQAIERFGGHVAQYLGDGVMAYFGYPEAHDNDAERAARAGLSSAAFLGAVHSTFLQNRESSERPTPFPPRSDSQIRQKDRPCVPEKSSTKKKGELQSVVHVM